MRKLTVLLSILFCSHLLHAQEPKLVLPIGHTENITGLCITPDHKYMVTASDDNTGKIWNYRTGKFMYDLVLHTRNINSLQMSKDGSFVVLASEDGSYSKWEVSTGKLLFHSTTKASIKDAILLKGDTSILLMKNYVMVIGGFTAQSEDILFDEIYDTYPDDKRKCWALSPDGNTLAIHQNKNALKIFDLQKIELKKSFEKITIDSTHYYNLEDQEPTQLFFSGNNQLNGCWGGYFMAGFDLQTNKQSFLYPRGKVDYTKFNSDNSLMTFKNGKDDSIRVWDFKLNHIKFIIPNEKKLTVKQFTSNDNGIILHKDKIIQEWSVEGKLIAERLLIESVEYPYNISDNESTAHNAIKNGIQTIDWKTGKVINEFSGKIPSVKSTLISADGRWLFEIKEKYAGYWDLTKMKASRFPLLNEEVVKKLYPCTQNNKVLLQYTSAFVLFDCSTGNIIYSKESGYENQLTVKGSSFYSADRGMVKKWDLTSGNMVTEWELGTNLHQVTFSPNDSLMAYEKSFYYNDSIIVWNLFLNSRVAAFQRPSQDKGSGFVKIYTPNYELAMRFSNDNKRLYYSSGEKGFISIMQLPFLEIYKYEDGADTSFNDMEMVYEEGTLEYFNDYLPIACSAKDSIDFISKDNEIGEDEIIGRDYYQRAKYGLKYPDFQRIIYLDEQKNQLHTATNKEWLIWDLKKKTILKKFTLPTAMRAIMYLPATQQLLLQSHDRIALQSMNDKTPAYFFSTLDKNETIAYRSDRFYMAGPSIAKWFSWNVEDKFYDFDQWDLQYNRPDKLLELVAQPDQNLHTAFLNAYSKRLQRNNVAEKDFSEDLLLPQTILLNTLKDGDQIMADSIVLQLKLIPVSKKSSLKNVLVYINDNPVWGRMGYALPVSKKTSQELQLVVKLSDGINRIKVSCTDVNGRESLREMLLVKHEPTTPTPVKTWFIGIGINRFEDSIHNLKWSVKDIRDLALKFKEKNNESISIDTLFDEAVTTENIQRLQAKLQQTNINDRVIISYSGHGLLSSNFDYYLSTYPVNFKNPEQNGLPYEALESLADGIPARKKLILIDACHSGEVDKEEMKQMQEVDNTNASTGAKGTRPLLVNKIQQPGSKNSFELMQELFSNLSSNTGATIIAAAAGTQFALEKNSLQNGVFSYAILEMMQAQSGISISQLNEQISKRVTELTHGQQVPSARKENITDDWMLW